MQTKAILSKDFILVAIGQVISLFGNQILRYALPLYLLNQTGSSVLFGTILACSFIPMLFLFPIVGIIADRVNKRNIMVMFDINAKRINRESHFLCYVYLYVYESSWTVPLWYCV